ncbi:MAG: hypothetical protein SGI71_00235, partial [Verrucomicrobiota bacterium]|nr:hypothetical protein [Verrucomicrobiota bacterium]
LLKLVIVLLIVGVLSGLGLVIALLVMKPDIPDFKNYNLSKSLPEKEQFKLEDDHYETGLKKSDLEDAVLNNSPTEVVLNSDQLNAYVAKSLKPSTQKFGPVNARFQGVNVHLLGNNKALLVVSYDIYGKTTLFQYHIDVRIDSGVLLVKYDKVAIGKLSIPKQAIDYTVTPLERFKNNFKNEQKTLVSCSAIEIGKGTLKLKTVEKAPSPEAQSL